MSDQKETDFLKPIGSSLFIVGAGIFGFLIGQPAGYPILGSIAGVLMSFGLLTRI